MRNRFEKKGSRIEGMGRAIVPVATFVFVFAFALAGIRSIGDTTDEEQLKSLKSSIMRSAVQCYALEGSYPESLSYLMENYGVTYDDSRYMVSYQAYGANMLPTITVLPLR